MELDTISARQFWYLVAVLWAASPIAGALCRWSLLQGPEELWFEAQRLAAAQRFAESEQVLRRLLARDSERTDARLLLAKLAHDRGDWATVAAILRGVSDSDPKAGPIRVAEGDAWLRLHRPLAAEDCWLRARRLSPEDPQPRFRLLYLYGIQLRREQWLELLWELYDRGEAGLREMIQLMIAGHVIWEPEEAAEELRRFAAADSNDLDSRRAIAEYMLLAGRFGEAEAELQDILQSHPDDAEAQLILVETHLGRGDRAAARECLAQLPVSAAADERYWENLAAPEQLENRPDDAVAALKEALTLAPFERELHQKLSQLLRLTSDADRAEYHAQTAGKLARIHRLCHSLHYQRPPRANDVAQVARLCEELGLIEEARGWTRVGLAMDEANRELLAARDRLAALPPTSLRHPPAMREYP